MTIFNNWYINISHTRSSLLCASPSMCPLCFPSLSTSPFLASVSLKKITLRAVSSTPLSESTRCQCPCILSLRPCSFCNLSSVSSCFSLFQSLPCLFPPYIQLPLSLCLCLALLNPSRINWFCKSQIMYIVPEGSENPVGESCTCMLFIDL